MYRVLLTCPPMIRSLDKLEYDKSVLQFIVPQFTQTLEEDQLKALVPTCDAWVIGDDPATRAVFESGRASLKAVVKWGAGVDNVDQGALRDMGIPFTNTPALFGESVSDVALGMLLMLTRRLGAISAGVRQQKWPKPCGTDLRGKTVCIVGLGTIGRALCRKLKAFGCVIRAVDPAFRAHGTSAISADGEHTVADVNVGTLEDNLTGAHVLILTCNLNKQTQGLIDACALSRLEQGAYVVNVSRGPVIVEGDLVNAMHTGQVWAAGLDVYETEPLANDSPLRAFDEERLVFGTHNASNSAESVVSASKQATEFLMQHAARARRR